MLNVMVTTIIEERFSHRSWFSLGLSFRRTIKKMIFQGKKRFMIKTTFSFSCSLLKGQTKMKIVASINILLLLPLFSFVSTIVHCEGQCIEVTTAYLRIFSSFFFQCRILIHHVERQCSIDWSLSNERRNISIRSSRFLLRSWWDNQSSMPFNQSRRKKEDPSCRLITSSTHTHTHVFSLTWLKS